MASSLEQVQQVYEDRKRRARKLKAEGRSLIGYLCSFTPVELITAAGLIPYRFTCSNRLGDFMHRTANVNTKGRF